MFLQGGQPLCMTPADLLLVSATRSTFFTQRQEIDTGFEILASRSQSDTLFVLMTFSALVTIISLLMRVKWFDLGKVNAITFQIPEQISFQVSDMLLKEDSKKFFTMPNL